ncbi:hypothetical protein OK016_16195 [Vibrio chagasii]|nr:hypothetical protein [Vibrio chagasii]
MDDVVSLIQVSKFFYSVEVDVSPVSIGSIPQSYRTGMDAGARQQVLLMC